MTRGADLRHQAARARRLVQRVAVRAHNTRVVNGIVLAIVLRPIKRRRTGETLVIAPPVGGDVSLGTTGNLGDQAMIEAFLGNVDGPVRLVVRGLWDVHVPAEHADRVVVEALPALLYGSGLRNLRAYVKLRRLLVDAAHLVVFGADVMDGAYNWSASRNRARVARVGAAAGVDTRIIGFSWNAAPHPLAAREVRAAADEGVRLLLRDPVSYERALASSLSPTASADLVFSSSYTDDVGEGVRTQEGIALLNVSGLVAQSGDQTKEFDRLIELLSDHDLRIILLPHVRRPGADDLEACRSVADRHPDKQLEVIETLLPPKEIERRCARATIVITGRMHLAVMALQNGTPAVALSTQGKVEGLFALFGAREDCVNVAPGFGDHLTSAARRLLENLPSERRRIADALPEVRRLSHLNYTGLPRRGSPAGDETWGEQVSSSGSVDVPS